MNWCGGHHALPEPTVNWRSYVTTDASRWTLLVRLAVGLVVFVPEGIQKLIFPELLGAGRFAGIGMPLPELTGPLVGMTEIVCGLLVIAGLFTRLATLPLIFIMVVALLSTKLPVLLGTDFWIFNLPEDTSRVGFWAAQHDARADLVMLLGSLYLTIEGAGRWSLDAAFARR